MKLLKDVTENITIGEDKSFTLNLNGKTLSGDTVAKTPAILNNGTVTITGSGTVKRDDVTVGGYYVLDNYGTMTIENGLIYNDSRTKDGHTGAASMVRNNKSTAILNIKGGILRQDDFIVVKNEFGTVNMTGGKITTGEPGRVVAVMNWDRFNASGSAIINGKIRGFVCDDEGDSTTTISGNASIKGIIEIGEYGDEATITHATLEISGGSFDVTEWIVTNRGSINITGGSFVNGLPKDVEGITIDPNLL